MNVEAGNFKMAGRAIVKVACPSCGWSNDGELEVVDRYETDFPPVPRGTGSSFLELYLDTGHDPDDRVVECFECGNHLDVCDTVERDPHHDVELLSELTDIAFATSQAHFALRVKLTRMPPEEQARYLSAENWLRMATPMLRGAASDLRKHIESTPKETP